MPTAHVGCASHGGDGESPGERGGRARSDRLADREATDSAGGRSLRLDRGAVTLITPAHWRKRFPAIDAPAPPWICGYTPEVEDIDATRHLFEQCGVAFGDRKNRLVVALPGSHAGVLTLTGSTNAA